MMLERAGGFFPFLVILLGIVSSARSSPTAATWTREVLLGTNDDHYFEWVSRWSQEGYHHSSAASMSLRKVRLADRRVVEEILVFSASYEHHGADGTGDTTLAAVDGFDMSEYLRENRVIPAFASDATERVVVQDSALWVLFAGDERTVLLAKEDLQKQIGRFIHHPRVVGRCDVDFAVAGETRTVSFYSIQLNSASYDDSWSEVLVLVPAALGSKDSENEDE